MIRKPTTIYKDFDLSFTKNPNTKDIARRVDVQAVKQALKSLLFDLHLNLYKLPILNPKTYRKIFGKLNLTSSFVTS